MLIWVIVYNRHEVLFPLICIIDKCDYSVYGVMLCSLPVQPAEAVENQVRTYSVPVATTLSICQCNYNPVNYSLQSCSHSFAICMLLALFCQMTRTLLFAMHLTSSLPSVWVMQLFCLDHFCKARPKSSHCAVRVINDRGLMFELHKSAVKQLSSLTFLFRCGIAISMFKCWFDSV